MATARTPESRPTWIRLSAGGKLSDPEQLPRTPGSYLLLVALLRDTRLPVGRLGICTLPRGFYAYCGSAFGTGGIRGRLARHLREGLPLHWHIDFLLRYARPIALAFREGDPSLECVWSQALGRLPNASFPARGFGASDCRRHCPSHLVLLSGTDAPARHPASPRPEAHACGTGRRAKERTCAEGWQAVKEALLPLLETSPHGA
ncbi:conserved protein of unknown function [Methylacidimicrobium sp. AP8]|uniref:GIY-YIG nuclease family protein n=1 Tax=Methylacidimicrobium sp. AP8 TaxID=2730359 RepID=UPI0018C0F246|nr:GIY-YIG nuclease family protein [Methylacidimicrobium sp. AP8]CAB4244064.1 conserved protein of unknown function [Methylacidimicrobium sp. AP8]